MGRRVNIHHVPPHNGPTVLIAGDLALVVPLDDEQAERVLVEIAVEASDDAHSGRRPTVPKTSARLAG